MSTQVRPSFLDRLTASRLIDAEKAAAACAAAGGEEDALAQHLVREGLLTRFQVRQLRAGATNFHVDKYVVVDCLGRGGNSVVFKSRHTFLPTRHVALKTLDARNFTHSADDVARLRH